MSHGRFTQWLLTAPSSERKLTRYTASRRTAISCESTASWIRRACYLTIAAQYDETKIDYLGKYYERFESRHVCCLCELCAKKYDCLISERYESLFIEAVEVMMLRSFCMWRVR